MHQNFIYQHGHVHTWENKIVATLVNLGKSVEGQMPPN